MDKMSIYELTPSQEVVKLQCKYSLFKRVINITMSITFDEKIDLGLLNKAYNLSIQRNDSARIKFFKKGFKLMQYFQPSVNSITLPQMEFSTEEEQNKFINKQVVSAIKYLRGEIIKPILIKTYNGKDMLFLKVCHLAFDIYGLNNFIKDLMEVYSALKNNEELPKEPSKFENVVKRDLKLKHDPSIVKNNTEFFNDFFKDKPKPHYVGLHGPNTKYVKAMKKKNSISMKMFFIKNDTKGNIFSIPKETVQDVLKYCEKNKITPANYLFYICNLCLSKINDDEKYILPLELCNMRGTAVERNCCGTKAQSLACYTEIKPELSFKESIQNFCAQQNVLYRHLGFSDLQFQAFIHKCYKYSLISILYPMAFSFIPMAKPAGIEFQIYSNGKGALPAYIAVMFDVVTNEMQIVYDCQTKLTTDEQVQNFHNNLITIINQVTKNDELKIKNIKVEK